MKKILVVNPFGIGDVLFTTPVVRVLKQKFPGSYIAFLCNRRSGSVLVNNPGIDELFFFTRGDLKEERKISYFRYLRKLVFAVWKLWSKRFDLVVDLSLVNQYSVIFWLVGIKERWGIDYKGRGRFLTKKISIPGFSGKHVIDYYRELMEYAGILGFENKTELFLSAADRSWADNFLRENNINRSKIKIFGIAPFGGESWGVDAKLKQWPSERFTETARRILKNYPAKIIFFGTKNDFAEAELMKNDLSSPDVLNVSGKTSLGQLAAMISECDLFISNDCGPMHMACALGVKTVSLFGPVDDKVYGPIGGKLRHQVAAGNIACRPCYADFRKPLCGDPRCMREVMVDQVYKLIEGLNEK